MAQPPRKKLPVRLCHCLFEQESLANTKVSARQPWYIGRNSLNRPGSRKNANINVIQQFRLSECGSIFIRLAVLASQKCEVAQNSKKIWTCSSSGSYKVDDFDTNRKRICHFLLVINNNFGPILHRFWDTVSYRQWTEILGIKSSVRQRSVRSSPLRRRRGELLAENFVFFLPLCHSAPPLLMFLLEFREVKHEETRSWGYSVMKVAWSTRVTDRRTARQMDGRQHIATSKYAVCAKII